VRCGAPRRGCVPLGRRRRRAAPHCLLVVPPTPVQPTPPAASARWCRRVARPILPVIPPPPPASNADCASGASLPSFRPCPLDMPFATAAPTRRSPLPSRGPPPSRATHHTCVVGALLAACCPWSRPLPLPSMRTAPAASCCLASVPARLICRWRRRRGAPRCLRVSSSRRCPPCDARRGRVWGLHLKV